MATFGSLSVAPWILFAQISWTMDAVPVITAAPPPSQSAVEIRDRAGLFGDGAERRAREGLRRIHRRQRTPVLIETVRSLDGAWVADVARRRAKMAWPDRLYVLVAAKERDVGVIGSRHGPASRLTDQHREAIRRAFLAPLQAGRPDEAIERGVRAIGEMLDNAAARSRPGVRDALRPVVILLAALAAPLALLAWARFERRRADADEPARGHPAAASRIDPGSPSGLRGPRWIRLPAASGSGRPP